MKKKYIGNTFLLIFILDINKDWLKGQSKIKSDF